MIRKYHLGVERVVVELVSFHWFGLWFPTISPSITFDPQVNRHWVWLRHFFRFIGSLRTHMHHFWQGWSLLCFRMSHFNSWSLFLLYSPSLWGCSLCYRHLLGVERMVSQEELLQQTIINSPKLLRTSCWNPENCLLELVQLGV